MSDLNDDVRRGHEAQALIDNPILKDAFAYLEQSYTDMWKAANTAAGREECWMALRAMQKLHDQLDKAISGGRLADAEIARIVNAEKQRKRYAG